jgi:hypothetical protein
MFHITLRRDKYTEPKPITIFCASWNGMNKYHNVIVIIILAIFNFSQWKS